MKSKFMKVVIVLLLLVNIAACWMVFIGIRTKHEIEVRNIEHEQGQVIVPPSSSTLKTAIPFFSEAAAASAQRKSLLTLPKEWGKKSVKIPGAKHAYYWHNVLHVFNRYNFRRSKPFTSKV